MYLHNKIVLHSEVHAVADAIFNYGKDECFERLFPRATIMIVELASDYACGTCHPYPKCCYEGSGYPPCCTLRRTAG